MLKKPALFLLLLITFLSGLRAEIRGPLPVIIGQATDATTGNIYSISTDGQPGEKSRLILLALTKPASSATGLSRFDSATILRTGKTQTVTDTLVLLRSVFQKFIAGATTGAVLGKLGSLEKGGEVEFSAAASNELSLVFKTPDGMQKTISYSKADAATFLSILSSGPKQ